ncbi:indole-3-glycerol phosphate synthase TrpC [Thermocrinis sp.]
MSFLQKVLLHKRETLRKDRDYINFLLEEEKKRESFFPLRNALRNCRTRIIAEVKKASPSAGLIREVDPKEQAKLYQEGGAVAISVLTEDKFFNGSLEDLREVRGAVSLPVLRKDFIFDTVQVLEAKAFGADAVLLIVKILDHQQLKDLLDYTKDLGLDALVEVFSLEEAEEALKAGAEIIGINNRDLENLKVDVSLSKKLAPEIKQMGAKFLVVESGIENREQILELESLGVDAFLVGTSLMREEDPLRKLRELLGFVI